MCNPAIASQKEETSPEKSRQMKSVERWEKLIATKLGTPEKVINQMIDFVKYPVITEKTYGGLIKKRQFTFDVDKRLTKPQIKSLFENLFKVNVMSVNTLIPPRKKLRVGIAQGFRPLYKRAIITLKEDQSLNFLIMNPTGIPAAELPAA